MTNNRRKTNQTLECLKLFAAFFIVYAHVILPEKNPALVDCLVRFTVPLFFAISGYFSYGIRSRKLVKRFWHIIRLNLWSVLAIISWNCVFAALQGNSVKEVLVDAVPSLREIANWLLLHLNPYSGHLWYLAAIAGVYAVLAVYVRFYDEGEINYKPLYMISAVLLLIRFGCSDLMRKAGVSLPYYLFRDGWFYGIPMLSLGIFLRQYQDQLIRSYHLTTARLFGVLFFGVALSLLQHATFGSGELPVGAIIQAAAMILLACLHPSVDFGIPWIGKLISTFGFLSTVVYVIQFCVYDAYGLWFFPIVKPLLRYWEIWFRPIIIALLSCIVGWMLYGAQLVLKKAAGRKR